MITPPLRWNVSLLMWLLLSCVGHAVGTTVCQDNLFFNSTSTASSSTSGISTLSTPPAGGKEWLFNGSSSTVPSTIVLRNCTFNEPVRIVSHNAQCPERLLVEDCTFGSDFFIENCHSISYQHIEFYRSTLGDETHFIQPASSSEGNKSAFPSKILLDSVHLVRGLYFIPAVSGNWYGGTNEECSSGNTSVYCHELTLTNSTAQQLFRQHPKLRNVNMTLFQSTVTTQYVEEAYFSHRSLLQLKNSTLMCDLIAEPRDTTSASTTIRVDEHSHLQKFQIKGTMTNPRGAISSPAARLHGVVLVLEDTVFDDVVNLVGVVLLDHTVTRVSMPDLVLTDVLTSALRFRDEITIGELLNLVDVRVCPSCVLGPAMHNNTSTTASLELGNMRAGKILLSTITMPSGAVRLDNVTTTLATVTVGFDLATSDLTSSVMTINNCNFSAPVEVHHRESNGLVQVMNTIFQQNVGLVATSTALGLRYQLFRSTFQGDLKIGSASNVEVRPGMAVLLSDVTVRGNTLFHKCHFSLERSQASMASNETLLLGDSPNRVFNPPSPAYVSLLHIDASTFSGQFDFNNVAFMGPHVGCSMQNSQFQDLTLGLYHHQTDPTIVMDNITVFNKWHSKGSQLDDFHLILMNCWINDLQMDDKNRNSNVTIWNTEFNGTFTMEVCQNCHIIANKTTFSAPMDIQKMEGDVSVVMTNVTATATTLPFNATLLNVGFGRLCDTLNITLEDIVAPRLLTINVERDLTDTQVNIAVNNHNVVGSPSSQNASSSSIVDPKALLPAIHFTTLTVSAYQRGVWNVLVQNSIFTQNAAVVAFHHLELLSHSLYPRSVSISFENVSFTNGSRILLSDFSADDMTMCIANSSFSGDQSSSLIDVSRGSNVLKRSHLIVDTVETAASSTAPQLLQFHGQLSDSSVVFLHDVGTKPVSVQNVTTSSLVMFDDVQSSSASKLVCDSTGSFAQHSPGSNLVTPSSDCVNASATFNNYTAVRAEYRHRCASIAHQVPLHVDMEAVRSQLVIIPHENVSGWLQPAAPAPHIGTQVTSTKSATFGSHSMSVSKTMSEMGTPSSSSSTSPIVTPSSAITTTEEGSERANNRSETVSSQRTSPTTTRNGSKSMKGTKETNTLESSASPSLSRPLFLTVSKSHRATTTHRLASSSTSSTATLPYSSSPPSSSQPPSTVIISPSPPTLVPETPLTPIPETSAPSHTPVPETPPREELPDASEIATDTVTTTTVVTSSASGGSGAADLQSLVVAMQAVGECGSGPSSNGFAKAANRALIPFSIGSTAAKGIYALLAVCFGGTLLNLCFVCIARLVKRGDNAWGVAQFPSIAIRFVDYAYQGLLIEIIRVLRDKKFEDNSDASTRIEVNTLDRVVAVLVLLLVGICLPFAMNFLMQWQRFVTETLCLEFKPFRLAFDDSPVVLKRLVLPRGVWASPLKPQLGALFNSFNDHSALRWFLFPHIRALLIAVVAASVDNCTAKIALLGAVVLLGLVLKVALGFQRVRLATSLSVVNDVIVLAIILLSYLKSSEAVDETTVALGSVAMAVSVIGVAATVAIKLLLEKKWQAREEQLEAEELALNTSGGNNNAPLLEVVSSSSSVAAPENETLTTIAKAAKNEEQGEEAEEMRTVRKTEHVLSPLPPALWIGHGIDEDEL